MTTVITQRFSEVLLVESSGSDEMICKAARVSTVGAASLESKESAGLINFLMRNRHGSPFEHGLMTFRISTPIFVWREFMRHRIGFSYNEQSGRYMELEPVFYRLPEERPLIQQGKPGHYQFVQGSVQDTYATNETLVKAYLEAWEAYQKLLNRGIAKEVARMCLPVGIFSTAYVSCNPRSLMNFLSLRTKVEGSLFPSYPQWEINQVATLMENIFMYEYPLTYRAFNENKRVAP